MNIKDTKVVPTQEFTNYSDAEVIELLQGKLFVAEGKLSVAELKYKRTIAFVYMCVFLAVLAYTANASLGAFWGVFFAGFVIAFILDAILELNTVSDAIEKLREFKNKLK